MRRIALFLTVFVASTIGLGASAIAQVNVAVIDLGDVFEKHPVFVADMAALKAEITQFDKVHRTKQEALVARFKQLRKQDPNSASFRTEEVKLAEESASHDVQKKMAARDFMQKEAAIYYKVYVGIQKQVNRYCTHYQISLVVHYNSKPMDPNNPATVMGRMNSNVIYQKPGHDITANIKQMCQEAVTQTAAATPAVGGVRR